MEGWNAGSIVKDCKGPESFSTCRGPQASDSHWSTPKHPSWRYEMRSDFSPELSHWCGNLIVVSVTQTFSLRFTCDLELEFNRWTIKKALRAVMQPAVLATCTNSWGSPCWTSGFGWIWHDLAMSWYYIKLPWCVYILRKPASWLVAVCERSENRGCGGGLLKGNEISPCPCVERQKTEHFAGLCTTR